MSVKENELIKQLLQSSKNGIITTKEITSLGLHRSVLSKLVENGILYRYSSGIYVKSDAWEDDMYLLQQKYSRGIYSHNTALYLLGYSDRTPINYTMTFPQGYNTPSLKHENIHIKNVKEEFYSMGVIEVPSPCGNQIRIYDLEKTLCDIVRGEGIDIQIITSAMQRYARAKDKNLYKLMVYANCLHVQPKIRHYMEVLL